MNVDDLLTRLDHIRRKPYRENGWLARCPAHEDHDPSLSIDLGEDGRILLKCFTGCTTEAICAALGLSVADLFPTTGQDARPGPSASPGQAGTRPPASQHPGITWYDLRDQDGTVVARHKRTDLPNGSKRYSWWLPGAAGPGLNGRSSLQLPLDGAHLLPTWPADAPIVLCEGEKAARTLQQAGIPALGTVTGADGCPQPPVLEVLRGRQVILWPDHDQPGDRHMTRIGKALADMAASRRWFVWPGAPLHGDAADYLAAGDVDSLRRQLAAAPTWPLARPPRASIISAPDLLALTFPPIVWAVPDLIGEGLTILAGKSSLGKSWLALALAVSVAAGGRALGQIAVEAGPVLYLALEDGPRRAQSRLASLLAGAPPPPALAFDTSWPRLDDGGLEDLDAWLASQPGARLVVIDTLKRVRPPEESRRRLYDLDYEAVAPLADLARSRQTSIVVVHHCRKADGEDVLDQISGSTGLTAAADTKVVLRRQRGRSDAYLFVDGRDLPGARELALLWDDQLCTWSIAGDADTYRLSQERADLLAALSEADSPQRPHELAEAVGRGDGAVRKLLWSMVRDGQVRSAGGGRYTLADSPPHGNTGNSGNLGNSGNGGNTLSSSTVTGVTAVTEVPCVTDVTDPLDAGWGRAEPGPSPPLSLDHCPTCHRRLGPNRVCAPCRLRACQLCGQPTGSLLRPTCLDCWRAIGATPTPGATP